MEKPSENSETVDALKLLFQRPNEPLFTAKDDGKTVFELPPEFYTERYKTIGITTSTRLGEDADRIIRLRSIQPPNLDFTKSIPIHGSFSLFNKTHQQIAGQLIELFLNVSEQDFISTAAYVKDRVNPYLYLVSVISSICSGKKKKLIFYGNLMKFEMCVVCFSIRYQQLSSIEQIHSTFQCHQSFNNSPTNS